MGLRLHLTPDDLRNLRLVDSPAPLHETWAALRLIGAGHLARLRAASAAPEIRPFDPAQADLVAQLVTLAGFGAWPGFVLPAESNLDAAVEAVLSAPTAMADDTLAEMADAGVPAAVWRDLIVGRGARLALVAALRHVHDVSVSALPAARTAPINAHHSRLRELLATDGVDGLLRNLHPCVRWTPPVLELTFSQTSRDVYSRGAGILIVPTWVHSQPSLLASNSVNPTALFYPVGARPAANQSADVMPSAALKRLLGPTRARVLCLVAGRPGIGTNALADAIRTSAATASHHLGVLRASRLITTHAVGRERAHVLTALGTDLTSAP